MVDYAAVAEGYNAGDMAWVIAATVFFGGSFRALASVFKAFKGGVLRLTGTTAPQFLYSGYTTRKNALATVWMSCMVLAVVSVQWMLFGYSLAYGPGDAYIGDATYFGHKGVMEEPVYAIPAMLYSVFQSIFACATMAIVMGGCAERARLTPLPVFMFLWATIVYCPIAHWTWAENGWLYTLGALDFAGGSPVHIASGAASMAISMYLSKPLFRSKKSAKRSLRVLVDHKPHNLLQLTLACVFIWGGWLSFDGASTLALNLRSAVALTNTQFSGSMGCDYLYKATGKWSMAAFVSGAISGLVAITPGCGFVGLPASLLFGAAGGTCCYWISKFKHTSLARKIGWCDPADVTGSHWAGRIIGNCLTGIFAQASIAATDGSTVIPGGWLDSNFKQLGIQIADCVSVTAYSFVVTYILVCLIDCIPGLEVLATDDDIVDGIDKVFNGESFGPEQWADEEEYHPFLGQDARSARPDIEFGWAESGQSSAKGKHESDFEVEEVKG